MAKYRRDLTKSKQAFLLDKYKKHHDAQGGIFTADKRRKLLGVKAKSRIQFHEDTADFWYDVRNTVKNGLIDLELISEVAQLEQLKEMFKPLSGEDYDDRQKRYKRHAPLAFLRYILEPTNTPVSDKLENWRYRSAVDIARMCMDYFSLKPEFQNTLHRRLIEDVKDAFR